MLGMTRIYSGETQRTVVNLWPAGTEGVDTSIPEEFVPRHFEIVKGIHNPNLTVFTPKQPNGAAVVICPGGAYRIIATGLEGYPIAEKLNEAGITAFVLKYRLPTTENYDFKHPVPVRDALRAIQWVRYHARDYGVDPKRIGIMGFSAGGHLAACAATMDLEFKEPSDAISKVNSRPDFLCLGYAVISVRKDIAHGCVRLPLKQGYSPGELQEMSCELNVNEQTPPTFLMHAEDDAGVLPQNSIVMYEALKKHKVQAQLKLYERGGHGYGLGRTGTDSHNWVGDFIAWLDECGFMTKPSIVKLK